MLLNISSLFVLMGAILGGWVSTTNALVYLKSDVVVLLWYYGWRLVDNVTEAVFVTAVVVGLFTFTGGVVYGYLGIDFWFVTDGNIDLAYTDRMEVDHDRVWLHRLNFIHHR